MKINFKYLVFSILLLSFSSAQAQSQNEKFIGELIKQIKEHPGQSLGYGASKIYRVYDISIPANAEIKEYPTSYMINPVEITLAVSNSTYDITKQKIEYKLTVFKEFKGSYAMARKDVGSIEVIWQKKESTKEFSAELKELKNLDNTEFDLLYGPEDDFPEEWKMK
jgi:hypothetical protein